MQLVSIILMDIKSTCTCVNKLLHVFNTVPTALKITWAYGVRIMDITLGKISGHRAVRWEQQRDLRTLNPATATEHTHSDYFVLSHQLP